MNADRRRVLTGALGLFGGAALGAPALAATEAKTLSLVNLHTGEKLKATFVENGRYVPDALQALNHLLRDHRTGESHKMAPGLLDLVADLTGKLDTRETVQIISGYRSPKSNAAMHRASSGVASHSLHMEGEAMDIRIAGVDLTRLRDAALSMQRGGVGFYPTSNFVHVDVGRVRRWQGA